jgi:gamma-glutamyl-gamma-aminobutyrate hydrolase PuuD
MFSALRLEAAARGGSDGRFGGIRASQYAIGIQWRQELLGMEHPGNRLFQGFVEATR